MDYTKDPGTYTASTDPKPQFGQSSDAVRQLQVKLNGQGAGLKVDGLYGPKTYAAANPNLIATSGSARNLYNRNSNALDSALRMYNIGSGTTEQKPSSDPLAGHENDQYMQGLDALSRGSDDASKMLIANIQAAKQRNANAVDSQYANYKSGLQLLGIQHNEAQSTPDLLMGHIQKAENDHQDKLQQLSSEESKAILDATNARRENDFKTLNAKMDYVKQIQSEKAATLKAYHDSIIQQPKIAEDVAHNIYATLQTLDDADKEAFLQQAAKQFNLPLGTLVTALSDEHNKMITSDLKTRNAQATLNKKLKSGSGTSTAKITKARTQEMENILNKTRGTDNHVDPYAYHDAYTSWTKNGGTTKSFITAFPPKLYVNPKATNLPDYLLPTKKSGRSANGK